MGEKRNRVLGPTRVWAYARRELLELRRDPIRLAFAFLGPVLLMLVFGYGISFDVEELSYAVLDRDRTPESRTFLENLRGSRYFRAERPARTSQELAARLKSGELCLTIEVPSGFGRDLKRGRSPEVGVWIDGAMPFRAETSRGYLRGVHGSYLEDLMARQGTVESNTEPIRIETRFRYNQDFRSVFAMTPAVVVLILAMIPAMLTAVSVVREKEQGSITNFYATPVTGTEFLLGKQAPYIVIAFLSWMILVLLTVTLFGVPIKGSALALGWGATFYVAATTGFGLFVSSFVKTQIAAIFTTAIAVTVPAVNFSGLFNPTSSLTGLPKALGLSFPSIYFQKISLGVFAKALGFRELAPNFFFLVLLVFIFFALSRIFLKEQEA